MTAIPLRTVFISYRRSVTSYAALAVYQHLSANGYDVFLDVEGMGGGKWADVLLRQIEARAHFVVVLAPETLDRCSQPGDVVRREIEHAIDTQRNIVPLMFDGFEFSKVADKLTGKLAVLGEYNGLRIHFEDFSDTMEKLRSRFLNVPITPATTPAPAADAPAVAEAQAEADAQPPVTPTRLMAEQYVSQGDIYYNNGEYDRAIDKYSEAIRLDPNYVTAYFVRGVCYVAYNDYTSAIADYTEAIRVKPAAIYYLYRAAAYRGIGKHDLAIADSTEVIRLEPAATYYRYRAAGYRAIGQHDLAGADEREAARLDSTG